MNFSWQVLLISLVGGLSTVIGALIVIFMKNLSDKSLSALLGFAAGIMLAIATLDLIPEAMELGSLPFTAGGFALGAVFMLLVDIVISGHNSKTSRALQGKEQKFYHIGILIASGIAFHNLTEGLALGAGFEVASELGIMLAIAIGLHNIPVGISIAAPLKIAGVKKLNIIMVTAVSGLFTLLGTAISFLVLGISNNVVAGAMAFAAGAIIYIAGDELIPQSHTKHSYTANLGIMFGFLLIFIIGYF